MNKLRQWLDRQARARFVARAEMFGVSLAIPIDVGVVALPPDASLRSKLLVQGKRGDIGALSRAVAALAARGRDVDGRVFVDVGANHGTTSLAALSAGNFVRVVACEPDPENARFLRATVALNGLEQRFVVLEAAVADTPGTAAFEAGPSVRRRGRETGWGNLKASGSIEVQVVSLDALVERGIVNPGEVGLLWMDVQGHEGFVLAGGAGFLAAGMPVVAAVRNRRLIEAGGRELFIEQVASRFETLIDLRRKHGPEEAVNEALNRLLREGSPMTDVLLLP